MKRKNRLWILGALLLAVMSCKLDTPAVVPVTGVTLSLSAQTLPPGTQYQLQASVQPPNATDQVVGWTSTASDVASVGEGLVQAHAEGAATIIASTHDGGYTATCQITVESQVIPPPPGLVGPVKAALYDGTTVRLWDGANTVDWKTGIATHGNGAKITVDQVLYFLDAQGAITQAINLPALPAGVTVIGDPVVWTFEEITREEAYAIDYTPGARTRIWQDGAEHGDWHAYAWVYERSFEAGNGDVIAVDNIWRFHDISRPEVEAEFTSIIWAIPGGPIFFVPDTAYPTTITVYDAAHPSGFTPAWSGASAWPRVPWIELGGVWYDGWGDKWDGATFYARATALSVFGGSSPPPADWQAAHGFEWPDWSEAPIVIPAYVDAGLIYFIETTTGTLWSYSPQTNVVSHVVAQLYDGDGKTLSGMAKAETLKPELVDGALYYHDAGTLWKRDNASTAISAFSVDQELWVMVP